MVVHIETKIFSVFGIVDEEGNVVQQYVVSPAEGGDQLLIKKLNEENFINAAKALIDVRKKLEEKHASNKSSESEQNSKD